LTGETCEKEASGGEKVNKTFISQEKRKEIREKVLHD